MKVPAFIVCLIAALGFLGPTTAHAHRVSIFAWVDGDTVYTESKFAGGRMVKEGVVRVFDMDGNLLLEGKTDDNGEFSFQVPKRVALRLELEAGAGHKNEWTIAAEELGEAQSEDDTRAENIPSENSSVPPDIVSPTPAVGGISGEEMEQIVEKAVEKAVDKKLKPIMIVLSELSDPGPKMSDVAGGIGYILGLVGVGAYFNSRRKDKAGKP